VDTGRLQVMGKEYENKARDASRAWSPGVLHGLVQTEGLRTRALLETSLGGYRRGG